ncbi:RnfABCDGE type electron transport complex subunit D [Pelagibacterium limicola]|uniref:RnfABCDGE type electron transport complex subunit D n=1 Tax=Pelagibacterium limicola TaxID=2791022 RepID=UPI0018AFCC3D|nr:RnfABCDGE type electron transport complex subunit D [Pelagibacterium limicola]
MIAGVWQRDTIGWVILAATLPVAGAAFIELGPAALWRGGLVLAVILVWQIVFLFTRAQPLTPIAFVTALSVALLAPGLQDPWQLALAVSFGVVIGEQVFGGWGRNVISAGVATLAFIYFGFPETLHAGTGPLVAAAVLPGGLMLIVTGIVSWQVIVSAVLGLSAVSLALGEDPLAFAVQGSLVFGLIYLVGDPVASAATRGGRWVYGALAGALTALFGWVDIGIDMPQAIVFAALLASLFAPLIDAGAVAVQTASWRRRNG